MKPRTFQAAPIILIILLVITAKFGLETGFLAVTVTSRVITGASLLPDIM